MKSPRQGDKPSFKQLKANWEKRMQDSSNNDKVERGRSKLARPIPIRFTSGTKVKGLAELLLPPEKPESPPEERPKLHRKNAFTS